MIHLPQHITSQFASLSEPESSRLSAHAKRCAVYAELPPYRESRVAPGFTNALRLLPANYRYTEVCTCGHVMEEHDYLLVSNFPYEPTEKTGPKGIAGKCPQYVDSGLRVAWLIPDRDPNAEN